MTLFTAIGDPGLIGGSVSHEYHYISDIGEDIICICPSCQYSINKAIFKESHCPKCKNALNEKTTAEVIKKMFQLVNSMFQIVLAVAVVIINKNQEIIINYNF